MEEHMGAVWQDVKYGVRTLRRQPGFSIVVVLTLALGIGATTAIFSLVWAMLLRPFPYADPAQLVRLRTTTRQSGAAVREVSLPDLDDFRARNHTFVDLGGYIERYVDLLGDGAAESASAARVTPGFFAALGVPPLLGRTFLPDEDRPGGDVHKAVLSYGLWQRRFHGDPSVLNQSLRTAQTSYTVVGVMPPGFGFPNRTELWTTAQSGLALTGTDRYENRANRGYSVIGRMRPGITLPQAQSDLDLIDSQLQREYPKTNSDFRTQLITLRESEVGAIRPYLLLLSGAVAFVLLIGCTNLANMQLARTLGRSRELALRTALGAKRSAILRQLLVESVLLALTGGTLGLALAITGVKVFPHLVPVPLPSWMRLEIHGPVLVFNLAASFLVGIFFGIAPAWQATRVQLQDNLKEGAKGSASSGYLRPALLVLEVAAALVLLVGAGLMLRSFARLQRLDPGFHPERLLTLQVSTFRAGKYKDNIPFYAAFHRRISQALEGLPGVVSVGGANEVPFLGQLNDRSLLTVAAKGDTEDVLRQRGAASVSDVMPGYFSTFGIPLLEGRDFRNDDTLDRNMVVIVSRRTAEQLFPGRPPLGRQIRVEFDNDPDPWGTIVGVVGDVKYSAQIAPAYQLYYPDTQYTGPSFHMAVRFRGDFQQFAGAVRQAVAQAEPTVAVREVKPMDLTISDSLWQQRLWGLLLAAFAGLAVVLAAVGVYGVMSYSVSQRARELGIRMALGAQPLSVLQLVTGDGMRLVGAGLLLGLTAAFALTRLLRRLLYEITTTDPWTYVGVSLALLVIALVACWIPARRAARLDPLAALRQE
jgi:predicted permease